MTQHLVGFVTPKSASKFRALKFFLKLWTRRKCRIGTIQTKHQNLLEILSTGVDFATDGMMRFSGWNRRSLRQKYVENLDCAAQERLHEADALRAQRGRSYSPAESGHRLWDSWRFCGSSLSGGAAQLWARG